MTVLVLLIVAGIALVVGLVGTGKIDSSNLPKVLGVVGLAPVLLVLVLLLKLTGTRQGPEVPLRYYDGVIEFPPTEPGRPPVRIPLQDLRLGIARYYVANRLVGTICQLQDPATGRVEGIWSDTDLPAQLYNLPDAHGSAPVQWSMAGDQLADFIQTLIAASGTQPHTAGEAAGAQASPWSFPISKEKGASASAVFASMGTFVLAVALSAVIGAFLEKRYGSTVWQSPLGYVPMGIFLLGILASTVLGVRKSRPKPYTIQLSGDDLRILCGPGKVSRSLHLTGARVTRLHWVTIASSRGSSREYYSGPGLEIKPAARGKVLRLGLSDPGRRWPTPAERATWVHFSMKGHAWQALLGALARNGVRLE